MSLNWDLTKIEDSANLCWVKDEEGKDRLSYITEALIWMCLTVDMNGITAKNVDEFWRRTMLFEHCCGPMLSKGGENYYLTKEDVQKHIGLSTNVKTESKVKFRTKLERMAQNEADRAVKRREREGDKLTLEQAAACIEA